MGRPKKAESKNKMIQIRVTEFQKNRIRMLADKWAGGNVSEWILYAAMEVDRKQLCKK